MLIVIGFVLYASYLSTAVTQIDDMTNAGLIKPKAAIPYQDNPVLSAVVDHYNTKSDWTGIFKIDRIIKFRIEKIDDKTSIAHVKYFFAPVPNNPKGRKQSGIDQRTFTFTQEGDEIKVLKMGAHNSTRL